MPQFDLWQLLCTQSLFLRYFRKILCSHIIHNQIQRLRIDCFQIGDATTSESEQLQVDIETLKYISEGVSKMIQDRLVEIKDIMMNIIVDATTDEIGQMTINTKDNTNDWSKGAIWTSNPAWTQGVLIPHRFDRSSALTDEFYNLNRCLEFVLSCMDSGITFIRQRAQTIPVHVLRRDSNQNSTDIWTLRSQLSLDVSMLENIRTRIETTLTNRITHIHNLVLTNMQVSDADQLMHGMNILDEFEQAQAIADRHDAEEAQAVTDRLDAEEAQAAADRHDARGAQNVPSPGTVAYSPAAAAQQAHLAQIAAQANAAAAAFSVELNGTDNHSDIPDDQQCLVCMSEYRQIICLPCGHCTLCNNCYQRDMIRQRRIIADDDDAHRRIQCTMCRKVILDFETITEDDLKQLSAEIQAGGEVTITHMGNRDLRIPRGQIYLNAKLPTRNGIPFMRDLILKI